MKVNITVDTLWLCIRLSHVYIYLLEIRLPQNLAKVYVVLYGLFVTFNQGPKAIHIV